MAGGNQFSPLMGWGKLWRMGSKGGTASARMGTLLAGSGPGAGVPRLGRQISLRPALGDAEQPQGAMQATASHLGSVLGTCLPLEPPGWGS